MAAGVAAGEGEAAGGAKGLDPGELYRRYAPAVYRRIRRFYQGAEAEEVLQEVFLVVLERGEQFRGESSPSTWLYRVATNHCLNRLRNSARRRELWLESKGELWFGESAPSNPEAAASLRQIWQELPEELVTIGVYYHVDGLSHEEIARIVGVSRRTVGNRLLELEQAAQALAR